MLSMVVPVIIAHGVRGLPPGAVYFSALPGQSTPFIHKPAFGRAPALLFPGPGGPGECPACDTFCAASLPFLPPRQPFGGGGPGLSNECLMVSVPSVCTCGWDGTVSSECP